MLSADYQVQEKNYESAFQSLNRYHHLKDSLELAGKAVQDTGFTEAPFTAGSAARPFPYFYFWLLFACMSGGAIFVYRLKR
jgi:hypothetical protein